MVDYARSAGETLQFFEHAINVRPVGRVALLDVSCDFEVFDDLREGYYTQETQVPNVALKISPDNRKTVHLMNLVRREISERDIEIRQAYARISDVKYEVPIKDLPFTPLAGDTLTDNLKTWHVVAWEYSTLGTRYRLWCRA